MILTWCFILLIFPQTVFSSEKEAGEVFKKMSEIKDIDFKNPVTAEVYFSVMGSHFTLESILKSFKPLLSESDQETVNEKMIPLLQSKALQLRINAISDVTERNNYIKLVGRRFEQIEGVKKRILFNKWKKEVEPKQNSLPEINASHGFSGLNSLKIPKEFSSWPYNAKFDLKNIEARELGNMVGDALIAAVKKIKIEDYQQFQNKNYKPIQDIVGICNQVPHELVELILTQESLKDAERVYEKILHAAEIQIKEGNYAAAIVFQSVLSNKNISRVFKNSLRLKERYDNVDKKISPRSLRSLANDPEAAKKGYLLSVAGLLGQLESNKVGSHDFALSDILPVSMKLFYKFFAPLQAFMAEEEQRKHKYSSSVSHIIERSNKQSTVDAEVTDAFNDLLSFKLVAPSVDNNQIDFQKKCQSYKAGKNRHEFSDFICLLSLKFKWVDSEILALIRGEKNDRNVQARIAEMEKAPRSEVNLGKLNKLFPTVTLTTPREGGRPRSYSASADPGRLSHVVSFRIIPKEETKLETPDRGANGKLAKLNLNFQRSTNLAAQAKEGMALFSDNIDSPRDKLQGNLPGRKMTPPGGPPARIAHSESSGSASCAHVSFDLLSTANLDNTIIIAQMHEKSPRTPRTPPRTPRAGVEKLISSLNDLELMKVDVVVHKTTDNIISSMNTFCERIEEIQNAISQSVGKEFNLLSLENILKDPIFLRTLETRHESILRDSSKAAGSHLQEFHQELGKIPSCMFTQAKDLTLQFMKNLLQKEKTAYQAAHSPRVAKNYESNPNLVTTYPDGVDFQQSWLTMINNFEKSFSDELRTIL